jgi:hypothetical protein
VSKGLQEIQTTYSAIDGSNLSPEQWTTGVVVKLWRQPMVNGSTGVSRFMIGHKALWQCFGKRNYRRKSRLNRRWGTAVCSRKTNT